MDTLKPKSVKDSQINDFTYRVFPNDLNSNGTVFGGLVMSLLDRIAFVIAERHSGHTCVTASVDALHFLAPAIRGDNLIIKGSINRVWNSSMEIGLKVIAENAKTGETKHVVSAYFTFVAVDDNQKPIKVAPIIPETKEQKRRFEEADIRRNTRFKHAEQIRNLRKNI